MHVGPAVKSTAGIPENSGELIWCKSARRCRDNLRKQYRGAKGSVCGKRCCGAKGKIYWKQCFAAVRGEVCSVIPLSVVDWRKEEMDIRFLQSPSRFRNKDSRNLKFSV